MEENIIFKNFIEEDLENLGFHGRKLENLGCLLKNLPSFLAKTSKHLG